MKPLSLIETLRYEPETGFRNLDRHRARMAASAEALGLAFDPDRFEEKLNEVPEEEGPRRVRLELGSQGRLTLTHAGFVPAGEGTVWTVRIARTAALSSQDPLLRHKTGRRGHYDAARSEFGLAEADEVLLLNERGEVCEGTITSLFLPDGRGGFLTPSLACGLLAGVERQRLLEAGHAAEAVIRPEDLAGRDFFVGNSLRGLIPARLLP